MDAQDFWRQLFTQWYDRYGSDSIRTYQIAELAHPLGFPVEPLSDRKNMVSDGKAPGMIHLGMTLSKKHRHVHSGLRLISDRIDQGWARSTNRSTYHLEPENQPRPGIRNNPWITESEETPKETPKETSHE